MNQDNRQTATDTADREIVTTRIFDAPPERVFAAWSSAAQLERWWGPRGFTTTTHSFDFRVGGGWDLTMHGPDGTDYRNRLTYEEIEPGQRIVYSLKGGIDGVPAHSVSTVTFLALGERTSLTMRMVFCSAAQRDAVVAKYDAVEGGKQTLARLGEQLGVVAREQPELRMSRVFDAPRRLVFAAWSTPEYLSRWFTPAPLTTENCEVDLRTGGVFRLVMRTPDGIEFPMDARFTVVVPEARIEFAAQVHGGLSVYTRVSLREHEGKTILDVQQLYSHEGDATRGAHEGWSSTLQQLAVFLPVLVASR